MEEGRQCRMNPEVFEAASNGASSFFDKNSNNTLRQVTTEKNTVLHVALQYKKFELAEKIVNLSPRLVHEKNSKGNTPLHVAAMVGTSSLVSLLIDHAKNLDIESSGGPLLNMLNLYGDTTLHVAVRYGKFEIVKVLIKEDAELAMCVNNDGESALFLAVDKQRYDMASFILSAAPDCSYAGRHGMNVLHALVIHTSIYSNKGNYLIQGDMEKERQVSRYGRLFITFIWVFNMLFLIPLLKIFEKASKFEEKMQGFFENTFGTIPKDLVNEVMTKWPSTIEQGDDSGWTPLHIAARLGNTEFVHLLLQNGNSAAYVRNKEGLSALHIAAKETTLRAYMVMVELLKACPDMCELLDTKGRNALHAAVESRSWLTIACFTQLPQFEGLINEKDKEGNTPMHLAAINGDSYTTSLLSDYARDVFLNATNKEGFTPLDNVLLRETSNSWEKKELWEKGARQSLRGALIKMGIRNLKSRSDGDGIGEGKSESDFWKRASETNMLVATLIATVSFTAAFTVPGGYNQNGSVHEGLAVLRKTSAFRVFLIANTLAFALSTTSVFLHFLASATVKDVAFHKRVARRTAFLTNWSIGALLVAFIVGIYSVVPHSLGITVTVLLCCCFLSSLFFPLSIKKKDELIDS